MSELVIAFPLPAEPMSLNAPLENAGARAKRRETARLWREAATYAAMAAFPGSGPSGRRLEPSHVYLSIPFPVFRHRDPHNYTPVVKSVVDGLVDAGLWPHDRPEYVSTHEPDLRVVQTDNIWKELVYVRVVPR